MGTQTEIRKGNGALGKTSPITIGLALAILTLGCAAAWKSAEMQASINHNRQHIDKMTPMLEKMSADITAIRIQVAKIPGATD